MRLELQRDHRRPTGDDQKPPRSARHRTAATARTTAARCSSSARTAAGCSSWMPLPRTVTRLTMLARSMPASGPDRLTTTAGGSSVTARRASRSWSLSLVLSAVCAASCGSPPPTTIASESFWPWNATACANGPRDAPRPKSVPSLGNECSEISDAVMCQQEWAPAGLNPCAIHARAGLRCFASSL